MRLLPARLRWFLGRPRTRACAQEDKRGVGNASERYRDSGGLDLSRSSRPRLRFQSARPCSRSCVLRRGGLGAAMEISGPLALWRSASTHQLVRPVGIIRYPAVDDTASSGRAPSPQGYRFVVQFQRCNSRRVRRYVLSNGRKRGLSLEKLAMWDLQHRPAGLAEYSMYLQPH